MNKTSQLFAEMYAPCSGSSEAKRYMVGEPYLPPFEQYVEALKAIWDSNRLTNQGPICRSFGGALSRELQLPGGSVLVSSGSIGLQLIIKAMGLRGDVICSPFTYIATASCAAWEGLQPVFADVDPASWTLDPAVVERSITSNTTAIIGTHVFGVPCDIEGLQSVASKYDLKLIFDAAHCFGRTYKGSSVLGYGDASMLSLHATKLFHSIEGGLVVSQDSNLVEKVEWMRRFGHDGPVEFSGVGINGKMSEFHAAMGLTNLSHSKALLDSRERQFQRYLECLDGFPGISFQAIKDPSGHNYAYFPILLEDRKRASYLFAGLEEKGIDAKRYFRPSLNRLSLFGGGDICPVAESIADRVLCLPMSHDYSEAEISWIGNSVIQLLEVA